MSRLLGLCLTGVSAHPAPAHLQVSLGPHPLPLAGSHVVTSTAIVVEVGSWTFSCCRLQHCGGCCLHRARRWLAQANSLSSSASAQAGGVCQGTRPVCWHAGVHADPVRHCNMLCIMHHGTLCTATCACGAVCCGRIVYRMTWGHLGSSQNAARIGTSLCAWLVIRVGLSQLCVP